MENKYQEFLNYDWSNSSEWRAYYNNLFPAPTGARIDHYKKKFYKLKIDPDFDINYVPRGSESSGAGTDSSARGSPRQRQLSNSFQAKGLLSILGLFSFCFFSEKTTLQLFFLTFITQLVNEIGFPELNLIYLQSLLQREVFYNVVYIVILFICRFGESNLISGIIIMSNMIIDCVINAAEFAKEYHQGTIFEAIILNKNSLLTKKAVLEICLVGFFVVGWVIGINSFFFIVLYGQFIKIKYYGSSKTKDAFALVNRYLEDFKNQNSQNNLVKSGVEYTQKVFRFFRDNGFDSQNAQIAFCQIF